MDMDRETFSKTLSTCFSRYGKLMQLICSALGLGGFTERSDLDFAILLSRDFEDPYDFVRLIGDLATALNVKDEEINLIILNDAHLEIAYKVISEGIIIFERDMEGRVDFEVRTIKAYLDFKQMLSR